MSVSFFSAKNGSLTCSSQNCMLHSAYSPEKEAECFVLDIDSAANPSVIVITGAGLPYTVPFLRKFFPKSKIAAVQYTRDFAEYDTMWDVVFYQDTLSNLYNVIDEENCSSSIFVSWKPSEQAFACEYNNTWQYVKKHIFFCRDILATRSYFGLRWLKNTLNFFYHISNISLPQKMDVPIAVTASGPSLEKSIPLIKKYRSRFFLLAVSSSVTPLLEKNIIPDAVISTDGGYWAKKHLTRLAVYNKDKEKPIPIAIPPESAVPLELFYTTPIIPLCYGDSIETLLFKQTGIASHPALRNGTVSGTAAAFALQLTSGPVCICGLDLQSALGLQHSRTNELEINSAAHDSRISSSMTRYSSSQFNSQQLSVYRDWFSAHSDDFNNRLYRIENYEGEFSHTLGTIPQCRFEAFITHQYLKENFKHTAQSFFITAHIKNTAKTAFLSFIKNSLKELHSICDISALPLSCELFFSAVCLNAYIIFKKEPSLEKLSAMSKKIENVLEMYVKRLENRK